MKTVCPIVYYFNVVLSSVPNSPLSVKAALYNDTSVILTWDPPNIIKGKIGGYQVVYSGYGRLSVSFIK